MIETYYSSYCASYSLAWSLSYYFVEEYVSLMASLFYCELYSINFKNAEMWKLCGYRNGII